ncbi:SAM-dependent methyltransferase [Actinomadura fibrosa]|uniref:SAM-dependent methyltransferase n=1 Tax=Actinomadura fibrosa TaxID=111802 RepID=A0ABW2XZE3_9ACTN|nr:SAM-dependent methyltransferase [Actinomadura fibrosa]
MPTSPDPGVASIARIYDAYLDGEDHLPIDRETAERVARRTPWAKPAARYNRAFMARAVEDAVRAGIRQVVDIGCGMPTEPSSFSAARAADPSAVVVGFDNDPAVLARAERMRDAGVRVLEGDIREPDRIVEALEPLIDWSRPVALVATAVLQFVPDELDPAGLLRVLSGRLSAGSRLVFTHSSTDGTAPEVVAGVEEVYGRGATAPITYRSDERIMEFLAGTRLLDPGLVAVQDWLGPDLPAPPDGPAVRLAAAVGVVPG